MLKKELEAKVRPLANASLEKASLQGAARIYISKDSLLSLTGTLDNGRACLLERLDDGQEAPLTRQASLWILPEKNLSPNVVVMTRAFQDATGFKIGDQVRITLADGIPDADEVVLEQIEGERDDEVQRLYPIVWQLPVGLFLGE